MTPRSYQDTRWPEKRRRRRRRATRAAQPRGGVLAADRIGDRRKPPKPPKKPKATKTPKPPKPKKRRGLPLAAESYWDEAAWRGKQLEWMKLEDMARQLRAQGFEVYARRIDVGLRRGEIPRGCIAFGQGEFGRELTRIWPNGGPDLVAINSTDGEILVGDATAREGSAGTKPIKPGEIPPPPCRVPGVAEEVHHLDKTKRDAYLLSERLPRQYGQYTIEFQDFYSESTTRQGSKRFKVIRLLQPQTTTPGYSRMTGSGAATDAERGVASAPNRTSGGRAPVFPSARGCRWGARAALPAPRSGSAPSRSGSRRGARRECSGRS